MTTGDARNKVRLRVGLKGASVDNTDFNDEIDEFVVDAVDRLFPIASDEYQVSSDFTLAKDTFQDDLSDIDASLVDIDRIYLKDSGQDDISFQLLPSEEWSVKSGKLTLRESYSTAKILRVMGRKLFTLTTLEAQFNMVVIYWAVAEFYEMLVGDKRKFNIYQQATGTRSVDALTDKAERAEDKANTILMDRVDIGGA